MSEELEKTKPENTGTSRDKQGKFIKGVSGNIKGKPKGSFSLIAMLKAELQKCPQGQRKTHAYLLIQRILKKAIADGDDAQIKNILQYIEGMPKQFIDLEHSGEIKTALVEFIGGKDGKDKDTIPK